MLKTLQQLSNESPDNAMTKVISVGNKCDIKNPTNNISDILEVSAKKGTGIHRL